MEPAEQTRGLGGVRTVCHQPDSVVQRTGTDAGGWVRDQEPGTALGDVLGARDHAVPRGLAVHPASPGRPKNQVESRSQLGGSRWRGGGGHGGAAHAGPTQVERRWPEGRRKIFRAVAGPNLLRQLHPGRNVDDGQVLSGMSPGRVRGLVPQRPPLQLLQQRAVLLQHLGDAQKDAGTRRRREGITLVRRMPRPGAVFQRGIR